MKDDGVDGLERKFDGGYHRKLSPLIPILNTVSLVVWSDVEAGLDSGGCECSAKHFELRQTCVERENPKSVT